MIHKITVMDSIQKGEGRVLSDSMLNLEVVFRTTRNPRSNRSVSCGDLRKRVGQQTNHRMIINHLPKGSIRMTNNSPMNIQKSRAPRGSTLKYSVKLTRGEFDDL